MRVRRRFYVSEAGLVGQVDVSTGIALIDQNLCQAIAPLSYRAESVGDQHEPNQGHAGLRCDHPATETDRSPKEIESQA